MARIVKAAPSSSTTGSLWSCQNFGERESKSSIFMSVVVNVGGGGSLIANNELAHHMHGLLASPFRMIVMHEHDRS